MGADSNTFTIVLPEMRRYKTLDVSWRLLFLLFWFLWIVIFFGNTEIPPEISFATTGAALVLSCGFAFYASRKQKALRPLINRRFAEEFSAKTGHEYPQNVDILAVKRNIAVREDDGSVLLWGVKRSTGSVQVTPTQARP